MGNAGVRKFKQLFMFILPAGLFRALNMHMGIVTHQEINRKLLGFPSYLGKETSFHAVTPGTHFGSRFEPHMTFQELC